MKGHRLNSGSDSRPSMGIDFGANITSQYRPAIIIQASIDHRSNIDSRHWLPTLRAWADHRPDHIFLHGLLEYGHPILLNCNNPAKENIRIAETTALRRLTKITHPNNPLHNPLNILLYAKTQVQSIIERAKMLSTKFARQHYDTFSPLCNTIPPGTSRKHKFPAEPLLQILNTLKNTIWYKAKARRGHVYMRYSLFLY